MGDEAFTHDVFLSHSTNDKAVVHAVAERLRKDGLQVWFELAPEGPRTEISESPPQSIDSPPGERSEADGTTIYEVKLHESA